MSTRTPTEFEKRILPMPDADFDKWVESQPDTMWAAFDLSACKIGWVASREFYNAKTKEHDEVEQ